MDQGRAAAQSRRQLDGADHPLERSLAVLAQHAHSPWFDPFVRVLFPDLDHTGFAALGKGSHAAARLVSGLIFYRQKPERAVEPVSIGYQGPELPR